MSRSWRTKLLGWVLAAVVAVSSATGFIPDVKAAENGVNAPLQESTSENISAELLSVSNTLTVAEAIAKGNNGEVVTVTGYVVGHATGSLTANYQSPFSNDYNFLIADAQGEQVKGKLVNVQIPSSLRASYGLQSNPGLIGKKVVVSGSLAAYNNFSGLKNVTLIELSGNDSGENPDPGGGNPDPGETPTLPDGTGKKVLFDNTHAQTAGAADWVIDGAFSDFADGLRSAGFTVSSLDRPIPYTFGEAPITYSALSDYDVFVIPEANIPFKASEQAALVQYVQNGGAVFFVSDHYNADRNKNRWDSSEVFNGYRRGAYENPAKGMSTAEASSPAMQGVTSTDWLADNFGVRFRYNAIGDVNANDIVAPSQAFGITAGVSSVAVHAGSTLAILDPQKAKGIVYVPTGVSAWGNAVDSGVYNGGGRAEGPYAAVSKVGLGKAAFIGDSSPVEDATPKYVREENGAKKTTYDGFKEVNDGLFLVQMVKWLAHDESYTSLSEVPGLQLDTATVLGTDEQPANTTEPQPEPWAAPAAGYKWYDPTTFKPGSYGSSGVVTDPVYSFVHQSQLPSSEEFQIRLAIDGLNPGQTISALKVGIYLNGGAQIARFKNNSGGWSDYNYSPEFSVTANALGHAAIDLTVQLKPGQSGAANLRLKQGSANIITKSVTIANVSAEPLPGDTGGVPQVIDIANARQTTDGTVVSVEGVVTSQPGVFGGQGFYLQDATGGIYVFQTAAGYQVGDVLKISATKTLYNGEIELENPVVIEKTGTLPVPVAEVQESVNDNNQGRIITLQNVEIQGYAQASPAGSFEFNALREDGSSTRIRIDGRTGITYADFTSLYPEGAKVSITGISSIFKGTYQLKPLALSHVAAEISDAIAPVTEAEVVGKTGQAVYNTQDVVVYFHANDDGGSGLSYTEYRVNGGEWTNSLDAITFSEDGKYAVEYRSRDNAGNIEDSKLVYINIDRVAPEIVVEGETESVLQTLDKLPFSIAVGDQISGVQHTVYTLDGKSVSNLSSIAPLSWSVGKHTLIVTAEDYAGHQASINVTFEVTIDIDHLDELIGLGEANQYIYSKGTIKSLQAAVSSLQKSKSNKERQLKISAMKVVIKAFAGKGMTKDFSKQMIDDLNYISKKIA
ncbi:Endonuclease YhcR precursor [compost metagenome]